MNALLQALVLLIATGSAAGQAPADTWKVRLADGSNTELTVSQGSGRIEFRNAKAVAFVIDAISITDIFHTSERVRRSTQAYNYFAKMCCGGNGGTLLPALAMAIAAPLGHSKQHFVEIDWYTNGNGSVLLELGKDEYVPFHELAPAGERHQMARP